MHSKQLSSRTIVLIVWLTWTVVSSLLTVDAAFSLQYAPATVHAAMPWVGLVVGLLIFYIGLMSDLGALTSFLATGVLYVANSIVGTISVDIYLRGVLHQGSFGLVEFIIVAGALAAAWYLLGQRVIPNKLADEPTIERRTP